MICYVFLMAPLLQLSISSGKSASYVFCALLFLFLPLSASPQSGDQTAYRELLASGISSLNRDDPAAARQFFEEALRREDGDSLAYLGLGLACFYLRRDAAAEEALERALALSPREQRAYQVLGDLYYRKDDLEMAAAYWEKALALSPGNEALRDKLKQARREQKLERSFNRDGTEHFSIRYEGWEKHEVGRIVLLILEDAYSEIGTTLSCYPERKIPVILYSDAQFREVTGMPEGTEGLYDGKIRIPIGGIEHETAELRKLLFHEYTHALVRVITPRVPAWLDEGLAQYFEGVDGTSGLKSASASRAVTALHLAGMEDRIPAFTGPGAGTAYLLSLSAVRYLIDTYGMYRVKDVLDGLGEGAGTAKAINAGLALSYEEFEERWKSSLQ